MPGGEEESEVMDRTMSWDSAPLAFSNPMVTVVGGTLSWNADTKEWKAEFATPYGATKLGGTYAEDGTLTLIEDSTGGYCGGDIPAIQAVLVDALAGWKHAPLSFSSPMVTVVGGDLSWNTKTMAWKAEFSTLFGPIALGGTYTEDGVLTLIDDSTGGFGGNDVPAIEAVFKNALKGIYCTEVGEASKYPPGSEALPGNAPEYAFESIVPMENSPLAGKNLCVLGSSVVYGINSMCEAVGEFLAARFGCALTKEALSGTTLADGRETSYIQRMLKNLDPTAQFDLFICQLSTNDATQKKPLGEISDSKELGAFDTATITGAMEYIICYARQTWNCPVMFFTGSYYDSAEYDAMVKRLMELQEKWDIGVLDLWNDPEFNNISDDQRKLYMHDDIHPTKAGYRVWWGAEMERQLLNYLAK